MKFNIVIIITLLFISSATYAQRKRAFLVGISNYDTALTDYEWNNIHGADDVALIAPLLKKQGFSTNTLLDEKATFKNITTSLAKFTNNCNQGDIVYIHFSCHGQPFEDLNGDETDGWDEALIPIDAYKNYHKGKYTGQNHILDDELSRYISSIRKKVGNKGFVYVVIDACHAGTSSRGDEIVRGTRMAFSKDRTKVYNPPAEKKTKYRLASSPTLANVVFLEACKADQVNKEIKISGKCYGALSYNIAQNLMSTTLTNNPSLLLERVKNSIKQKGNWPNNQNLVIESSF